MWQAVFFDFDGVILDSVDAKTQAFASMYRNYGTDIEKAVVEYHMAHGGVSRFEKFKYYHEQLLNKPVSEEELQELGTQFSDLALEKVLNALFIEGAHETLRELVEKNIPAFVVSGTPDEEIKLIVEKRGLSKYFREVHGSPRHKDELISDISQRFSLKPEKCLFIGDAMTDYKAAKATGVHFLGVVLSSESSPFPEGTNCSTIVHIAP